MRELTLLILIWIGLASAQTGGRQVVPIDDDIREAAFRATNQKVNDERNDYYHMVPVTILKAERQIVSGTITYLEVIIQETDCTKNRFRSSQVNLENCPPKDEGRKERCLYEIWTRAWENFEQIKVNGCSPFKGNVMAVMQPKPTEKPSELREASEGDASRSAIRASNGLFMFTFTLLLTPMLALR